MRVGQCGTRFAVAESMTAIDKILERAREGRHTLVLGTRSLALPPGPRWCVVQVDCAATTRPLVPLVALREQLERLVREASAPIEIVDRSLRHAVLRDHEPPPTALVELVFKLQRQLDRPLIIVLSSIDRADAETCSVVARLMASALRVSIVLTAGRLEGVHPLLRDAIGDGGIVSVPPSEDRDEATSSARPRAGELPAAETEVDVASLGPLPFDVLRVLRAGALIGDRFEIEVTAALLGIDTLTALELLQLARDQGVPLHDDGSGVFTMSSTLAESLRAELTPSLAAAWHAEAAAMLAEQHDFAPAAEAMAMAAGVQRPAMESPATHSPAVQRAAASSPAMQGPSMQGPSMQGPSMQGPAAPSSASQPRPASPRAAQTTARAPEMRRAEAPQPAARALRQLLQATHDGSARAAEHAEQAGDPLTAARRYLDAATEAMHVGGNERAVAVLTRALELVPVQDDASRLLRIRILGELGRARWLCAGDAPLSSALDVLEQGRGLLRDDDDPAAIVELDALIAHVHYDIGEDANLVAALAALARAQRVLLDAGQPTAAASLLNDEAAVRVRMGEHERAATLLKRSREIFLRYADAAPEASMELAATDHLVARLALHADAVDAEGLDFVRECARNAERRYADLGIERERARAWETLGRLAHLANDRDEAVRYLQLAIESQHTSGDAIGLARTTAALAQVLMDRGEGAAALEILDDSVSLNLQTGSRRGLAYNQQSLDQLVSGLAAGEAVQLQASIGRLRARITPGSAL